MGKDGDGVFQLYTHRPLTQLSPHQSCNSNLSTFSGCRLISQCKLSGSSQLVTEGGLTISNMSFGKNLWFCFIALMISGHECKSSRSKGENHHERLEHVVLYEVSIYIFIIKQVLQCNIFLIPIL